MRAKRASADHSSSSAPLASRAAMRNSATTVQTPSSRYQEVRCVECLADFDDDDSHRLAIGAGKRGLTDSGRPVVHDRHVTQREVCDKTFSRVDKHVHGDCRHK